MNKVFKFMWVTELYQEIGGGESYVTKDPVLN